jgi:hypothetical protein
MRTLVIIALLVAASTAAAAPDSSAPRSWQPLLVHIECQGQGRTRACPAFLRGFIDETPLLAPAPRARAQVSLYYNVTFRADDDHVHLRFTAADDRLPREYEVTQVIDIRTSDDQQRARLRPAFKRGIAVFLGALNPDAVRVSLVVPTTRKRVVRTTTPWGFSIWTGGWGNYSRSFKSASMWGGFGLSRVTTETLLSSNFSANYGLTRQPPLVVDGEEISLDVDSYSTTSRLLFAHLVSPHWSTGALVRAGRQDREGQYDLTGRLHSGISYDYYPANDPRGNVLAAAYLVGYQADWYNVTNVLGQERAHFPSHGVLANGSVRVDKTTFRLRASAFAQLVAPRTRYVVELAPEVSVQLGDHVDLSLSMGITKQAVPGPEFVDEDNYEEVTRASYAEPLRLNGYFNLRIHWDRTNPDRNNRWNLTNRLGLLGTL